MTFSWTPDIKELTLQVSALLSPLEGIELSKRFVLYFGGGIVVADTEEVCMYIVLVFSLTLNIFHTFF